MPVLLFALSAVLPMAEEASTPPPYGGPVRDSLRAPATGFFQVRQVHGRWWLIDPRGRGFYLVDTDHIRHEGHGCEALGYAPYGGFVGEKYKSEEAWAEATLERLKAWGFNTSATAISRVCVTGACRTPSFWDLESCSPDRRPSARPERGPAYGGGSAPAGLRRGS